MINKYFKRKIDLKLCNGFINEDKSLALVVGIRHCGKAETIGQFIISQNNYLIEFKLIFIELNEGSSSNNF